MIWMINMSRKILKNLLKTKKIKQSLRHKFITEPDARISKKQVKKGVL